MASMVLNPNSNYPNKPKLKQASTSWLPWVPISCTTSSEVVTVESKADDTAAEKITWAVDTAEGEDEEEQDVVGIPWVAALAVVVVVFEVTELWGLKGVSWEPPEVGVVVDVPSMEAGVRPEWGRECHPMGSRIMYRPQLLWLFWSESEISPNPEQNFITLGRQGTAKITGGLLVDVAGGVRMRGMGSIDRNG